MTRLIPTRQTWLLILVIALVCAVGPLALQTELDVAQEERIHAQGETK